jgi:hypothetical protein
MIIAVIIMVALDVGRVWRVIYPVVVALLLEISLEYFIVHFIG